MKRSRKLLPGKDRSKTIVFLAAPSSQILDVAGPFQIFVRAAELLVQERGNYETEHSGGPWVSDQVKSVFEEMTQVMRNWGKSYVKWSLALDQNRGPHTGGCGTCPPVVTLSESSVAVMLAKMQCPFLLTIRRRKGVSFS